MLLVNYCFLTILGWQICNQIIPLFNSKQQSVLMEGNRSSIEGSYPINLSKTLKCKIRRTKPQITFGNKCHELLLIKYQLLWKIIKTVLSEYFIFFKGKRSKDSAWVESLLYTHYCIRVFKLIIPLILMDTLWMVYFFFFGGLTF